MKEFCRLLIAISIAGASFFYCVDTYFKERRTVQRLEYKGRHFALFVKDETIEKIFPDISIKNYYDKGLAADAYASVKWEK